jgi:hypothetical protein
MKRVACDNANGLITVAVEDDRPPARAEQSSDLPQRLREHQRQAGIRVGGDDEERVAALIVASVISRDLRRISAFQHPPIWDAELPHLCTV